MLSGVMDTINGYKVYILMALGIFYALCAHFLGQVQVGSASTGVLPIPYMDTDAMLKFIWGCLVGGASRHTLQKIHDTLAAVGIKEDMPPETTPPPAA